MVLWFWPDDIRNAVSTMDFVAAGDNNHSPYRTEKSPEHSRLNPSPRCAQTWPRPARHRDRAPGTRNPHQARGTTHQGTRDQGIA
jgi:hypothetical protein